MAVAATSLTAPSPPPTTVQQSPWNSPLPYLFGSLAATLGLIAFALLILACSFWKRPGDTDRDIESGDAKPENKEPPVFEEKCLVIMAGEAKPTFLATPVSSSRRSNSTEQSEKQVQLSNIGNHESSDQV
ncbi:protein GLUTAMINE DUMPER 3-like [Cynara cardunculus var. scolymus]|uniref:protein GLUTAMINE DUMPER 3-like n=1 Tax=Cynara cardunculus var. scolymus TaxID=59895 RepID=UPI000D62ED32|nr:protein GLUTAMINE DUMPER 3-like [Cynara cardunculus var. scolymus]